MASLLSAYTCSAPKLKFIKPDEIVAGAGLMAKARVISVEPAECPPENPVDANEIKLLSRQVVSALAWHETEAGKAISEQTFSLMKESLDEQLSDLPAGKTPYIVVDVDDMVVNSKAYFGGMVGTCHRMNTQRNRVWWFNQPSEALAGSKAFLDYAKSRGVEVHYVTARENAQEIYKSTLAMLSRLDFPLADDKHVHISSDKNAKTQEIKDTFKREHKKELQLLMRAGDKCSDVGCQAKGSKAEQKMKAWFEEGKTYFGQKLFIQPNAAYGSWERVTHFKYQDITSARQEGEARQSQICNLAGVRYKKASSDAHEQVQAVLYGQSMEYRIAVKQALLRAKKHYEAKQNAGRSVVMNVQLEGVVFDTTPFVAGQVVNKRFARLNGFKEYLEAGSVVVQPDVKQFLCDAASSGVHITYTGNKPGDAEAAAYKQTVQHCLTGGGLPSGPVVTNMVDIGHADVAISTGLPRESMLRSDTKNLLIPAPHQFWEWLPGLSDDVSVDDQDAAVDVLEARLTRWRTVEEVGFEEEHYVGENYFVKDSSEEGSDKSQRSALPTPAYSTSKGGVKSQFLVLKVRRYKAQDAR